MRGIPKHITTKADLRHICKDAPLDIAQAFLDGLTNDDISRLDVTSVDVEDCLKLISSRKRVVERKLSAIDDARATLARTRNTLEELEAAEAALIAQIRKIEQAQPPESLDDVVNEKKGDMRRHDIRIAHYLNKIQRLKSERRRIETQLDRCLIAVQSEEDGKSDCSAMIQSAQDEQKRRTSDCDLAESLRQQAQEIRVSIADAKEALRRATNTIARLEE